MRQSGLSAAVAFVVVAGLVLVSLSMNKALAQDIDDEDYQTGLMLREDYLQQSSDNLETAKEALALTVASLMEAEENLRVAKTTFGDVELTSDSDALTMAWEEVTSALVELDSLIGTGNLQLLELEQAENKFFE